MNSENKEEVTATTKERLNSFFENDISADRMAKNIRRVNHILVLISLQERQDDLVNKEWLSDGYYWLNELAEILDPNLSSDIITTR